MKSYTTAVLLAASAIPAVLAQMQVNSLTGAVVCEPIQITWSGGQPPYYLFLIPAGQSAAAPIKYFPTQNGTSYTWNVDLPVNTGFTTQLKDSTGAIAYSGEQMVLNGTDTSCVNNNITVTAGPASTPTASAGPTASGSGVNPGVAVASPTTSKSETSTGTHSSGTSTATPSDKPQLVKNSATQSYALGAVGIATVFGLIGFAMVI